MFALIFVYLSYSIYSGIYESAMIQIQKSNYSGGLPSVLTAYFILITCANVFFLMYLFLNYFREKVRNYDILQLIGGSRWLIVSFVVVEYLFMMLLTIFLASTINLFMMLVLRYLMKMNIQYLLPPIYVNILYIFVVFISICVSLVLILKRKRIRRSNKLMQWIDKRIHIIRNVVRRVFVCIGLGFCGWSIYLLVFYSVVNMFLSILFALIGIFLVSAFALPIILEKIKKNDKIYAKHLVTINNFRERLKSNNLIFRVLVILNFAIVFIVGSLIISYISIINSNTDDLSFPYEEVIITSDTYILQGISLLASEEFPGVLMGLEDYNGIIESNEKLADREIIYITQMLEDDDSPYGQDTMEMFVDGAWENFKIKHQEYRIVFGEFLSPELRDIIVVSPDTFKRFKNSQSSESLTMLLSQDTQLSEQLELSAEDIIVFNKDLLISAQQSENNLVLFTIISLGIIALVTCWFMIYIKIRAELSKSMEQYRFLEIMGMEGSELIKLSLNEISLTIIPGMAIGYIWGIIDFYLTCIATLNVNENENTLLMFMVYLLIVSIVQMVFYISLRRYFRGVYSDKLFNIDKREVVNFESV